MLPIGLYGWNFVIEMLHLSTTSLSLEADLWKMFHVVPSLMLVGFIQVLLPKQKKKRWLHMVVYEIGMFHKNGYEI